MGVWYETCVSQKGQVRDVCVRGNLEGAKRAVDYLRLAWPQFDMIFIRRHGKRNAGQTSEQSFRVLHNLTVKREVSQ